MSRAPASRMTAKDNSPGNWRKKVSDSVWHQQLSSMSSATPDDASVYWLEPFQNYKAMCPYLVGSYEQVGDELATIRRRGLSHGHSRHSASDAEELTHTFAAFEAATQQAV